MTSLILIACMIAAQTGATYALRGQPVYTALPAASGGSYTLQGWTGPFGASSATLSVAEFIPPTDTYDLSSGATLAVTHHITLGAVLIGLLLALKTMLLALYALTSWLETSKNVSTINVETMFDDVELDIPPASSVSDAAEHLNMDIVAKTQKINFPKPPN